MSDLFADSWGTGTPVVLVGSLATGAEEWQAQRYSRFASSSSAAVSTRAPAARSSGFAFSASLCEIPFSHGTKIIPVGQIARHVHGVVARAGGQAHVRQSEVVRRALDRVHDAGVEHAGIVHAASA